MGQKYKVGTIVLRGLENETPGQIPFDDTCDRPQWVELETWQYDILVSHMQGVLYSQGGVKQQDFGVYNSYTTTLDRLLRIGNPIERENKDVASYTRARTSTIQQYPKFDGTQPCASVGVTVMYPEDTWQKTPTGKRHRVDGAFRSQDIARLVCDGCEFMQQCLTWALHHEEFGIWGGTTAGERRRMRKEKGIKLVDPYTNLVYSSALRESDEGGETEAD